MSFPINNKGEVRDFGFERSRQQDDLAMFELSASTNDPVNNNNDFAFQPTNLYLDAIFGSGSASKAKLKGKKTTVVRERVLPNKSNNPRARTSLQTAAVQSTPLSINQEDMAPDMFLAMEEDRIHREQALGKTPYDHIFEGSNPMQPIDLAKDQAVMNAPRRDKRGRRRGAVVDHVDQHTNGIGTSNDPIEIVDPQFHQVKQNTSKSLTLPVDVDPESQKATAIAATSVTVTSTNRKPAAYRKKQQQTAHTKAKPIPTHQTSITEAEAKKASTTKKATAQKKAIPTKNTATDGTPPQQNDVTLENKTYATSAKKATAISGPAKKNPRKSNEQKHNPSEVEKVNWGPARGKQRRSSGEGAFNVIDVYSNKRRNEKPVPAVPVEAITTTSISSNATVAAAATARFFDAIDPFVDDSLEKDAIDEVEGVMPEKSELTIGVMQDSFLINNIQFTDLSLTQPKPFSMSKSAPSFKPTKKKSKVDPETRTSSFAANSGVSSVICSIKDKPSKQRKMMETTSTLKYHVNDITTKQRQHQAGPKRFDRKSSDEAPSAIYKIHRQRLRPIERRRHSEQERWPPQSPDVDLNHRPCPNSVQRIDSKRWFSRCPADFGRRRPGPTFGNRTIDLRSDRCGEYLNDFKSVGSHFQKPFLTSLPPSTVRECFAERSGDAMRSFPPSDHPRLREENLESWGWNNGPGPMRGFHYFRTFAACRTQTRMGWNRKDLLSGNCAILSSLPNEHPSRKKRTEFITGLSSRGVFDDMSFAEERLSSVQPSERDGHQAHIDCENAARRRSIVFDRTRGCSMTKKAAEKIMHRKSENSEDDKKASSVETKNVVPEPGGRHLQAIREYLEPRKFEIRMGENTEEQHATMTANSPKINECTTRFDLSDQRNDAKPQYREDSNSDHPHLQQSNDNRCTYSKSATPTPGTSELPLSIEATITPVALLNDNAQRSNLSVGENPECNSKVKSNTCRKEKERIEENQPRFLHPEKRTENIKLRKMKEETEIDKSSIRMAEESRVSLPLEDDERAAEKINPQTNDESLKRRKSIEQKKGEPPTVSKRMKKRKNVESCDDADYPVGASSQRTKMDSSVNEEKITSFLENVHGLDRELSDEKRRQDLFVEKTNSPNVEPDNVKEYKSTLKCGINIGEEKEVTMAETTTETSAAVSAHSNAEKFTRIQKDIIDLTDLTTAEETPNQSAYSCTSNSVKSTAPSRPCFRPQKRSKIEQSNKNVSMEKDVSQRDPSSPPWSERRFVFAKPKTRNTAPKSAASKPDPNYAANSNINQERKARYNDLFLGMTQEDALKEQERLLQAAASRMRTQARQARAASGNNPATSIEQNRTFPVRIVDVDQRFPDHWQYKEPYARLGLPPTATDSVIKSQYRKLALVYHPDRNLRSGDTKHKFQAVTEAYSILTNR